MVEKRNEEMASDRFVSRSHVSTRKKGVAFPRGVFEGGARGDVVMRGWRTVERVYLHDVLREKHPTSITSVSERKSQVRDRSDPDLPSLLFLCRNGVFESYDAEQTLFRFPTESVGRIP